MSLSPYQTAAIRALAAYVGCSLDGRCHPLGLPTTRALGKLGLVLETGGVQHGYNRRSGRAWSHYGCAVTLTDEGWRVAGQLGVDVRAAFTKHAAECERLSEEWGKDRKFSDTTIAADSAESARWAEAAVVSRRKAETLS